MGTFLRLAVTEYCNMAGPITNDTDRDRGILTPKDREFLRGESDVSKDTARVKQHRIRERFKNGIADLAYLTELTEDLEPIFNSAGDSSELLEAGLLALVYAGRYEWGEEALDAIEQGLWYATSDEHLDHGYFAAPHRISFVEHYYPGDAAVQLEAVKDELESAESVDDLSPVVRHTLEAWPSELLYRLYLRGLLPDSAPSGFEELVDDEVSEALDSHPVGTL